MLAYISGCASSVVTMKPLRGYYLRSPSRSVAVFSKAREVRGAYEEIAILKAEYSEKKSHQIEILKEKAKEIGADGIVLRDVDRGLTRTTEDENGLVYQERGDIPTEATAIVFIE